VSPSCRKAKAPPCSRLGPERITSAAQSDAAGDGTVANHTILGHTS
jgi:hypothetical protein